MPLFLSCCAFIAYSRHRTRSGPVPAWPGPVSVRLCVSLPLPAITNHQRQLIGRDTSKPSITNRSPHLHRQPPSASRILLCSSSSRYPDVHTRRHKTHPALASQLGSIPDKIALRRIEPQAFNLPFRPFLYPLDPVFYLLFSLDALGLVFGSCLEPRPFLDSTDR